MSEICKFKVGRTLLDLKDAQARESIEKLGSIDKPLCCPFYIKKDSVVYKCDICDDEDGIDWNLTKQEE